MEKFVKSRLSVRCLTGVWKLGHSWTGLVSIIWISGLSSTMGIWNPDWSGSWMVKKGFGCKWSGFWMGNGLIVHFSSSFLAMAQKNRITVSGFPMKEFLKLGWSVQYSTVVQKLKHSWTGLVLTIWISDLSGIRICLVPAWICRAFVDFAIREMLKIAERNLDWLLLQLFLPRCYLLKNIN